VHTDVLSNDLLAQPLSIPLNSFRSGENIFSARKLIQLDFKDALDDHLVFKLRGNPLFQNISSFTPTSLE
jgi:hypothetical protein